MKDVSQVDLADKAGVSVSYLNQIECGKCNPSMEIVGKIAEALDVTVADLVSELEFSYKAVE